MSLPRRHRIGAEVDSSLLIVLAGVAAIAIAAFVFVKNKKRIAAFNELAAEHGWTFVKGVDRELTTELTGQSFGHRITLTSREDPFPFPFDTGDSRRAENVMAGQFGTRGFRAFDYSYQTSTTDSDGKESTSTHRFAIAMVDLGVALPDLHVKPENVLTRLGGRLTNTDIQFEDEEFNRAFTITCPDRKFASDVIHQLLIEMLKTEAKKEEWRFMGSHAVLIRKNQNNPARIVSGLELLTTIVDSIPEFVLRDARAAD